MGCYPPMRAAFTLYLLRTVRRLRGNASALGFPSGLLLDRLLLSVRVRCDRTFPKKLDTTHSGKGEWGPTHEQAQDFQFWTNRAFEDKAQRYRRDHGERREFFPNRQKPIDPYQWL